VAAARALAQAAGARAAEVVLLLDEGVLLDFMMDWPGSRARAEEADALVAATPLLGTPAILARLHMARGRTHMRANQFAEAIAAFGQAAEAAEQAGDDGYEALAQTLAMWAFSAGSIGRHQEGNETINRCITLAEQHGDMIGVAVALQNRGVTSFLTGNVDRFVADFERVVQIAREYGFAMSECCAVRDLAEVSLVLGRTDEAMAHAQRAHEMYTQQLGTASRIVYAVDVQIARIAAYQGDLATAETIVRRVIALQAEARAAGRNELLLVDGERVLLDATDFLLRGDSDAQFDALAARGRELQLQPPDLVEILEWKGLSALRAGRVAAGLTFLADALAAADGTPAAGRVQRRIAQARREASAPRRAGNAS
ncbi:MAG TPA: hypothetical protein VIF57_24350, partial [Polyangia bacterium]